MQPSVEEEVRTEWEEGTTRFVAVETWLHDGTYTREVAKYTRDNPKVPEWTENAIVEIILATTDEETQSLRHLREAAASPDAPEWLRALVRRSGVVQDRITPTVLLLSSGRIVKRIAPDGVDEGTIQMLLGGIPGLQTPHVFAFSEHSDLGWALVMKRYGQSGSELLRSMNPGPERRRVALLLVAHTLLALANIKANVDTFVHGDLHPGNVFLAPREEGDELPNCFGVRLPPLPNAKVILGDFGRSRLTYTQTLRGPKGVVVQRFRTLNALPGLVLSKAADMRQLCGKTMLWAPETKSILTPVSDLQTDTAAQTVSLAQYVVKSLQ